MRVCFVFPGSLDTPTGGYHYDRAILTEWQKAGLTIERVSLAGSYPFPSGSDIEAAVQRITNVGPADIGVVDGLAGGGAPLLLDRLSHNMPAVALIHHPLALENGLSAEVAGALLQKEKAGLAFARAVVTTSAATSRCVHDLFDFPASKIFTVLPGVERGGLIEFRNHLALRLPLRLLCVASITERKGHDVLLRALAKLRHLDWCLDLVGPTHFDAALFNRLKNFVHQNNLSERVIFHGAVESAALEAFYCRSDLFVLASHYEGYGMAYAEAIVRGLPVIATTAGAIPDTVPAGAGVLVAPNDVEALAQALAHMIEDPAYRLAKHKGAVAAAPDFPTWQQSASLFADILGAIQ